MAERTVIVVGASAGGIEALRSVVRDLPEGLPAALLIVTHIPAIADSHLPEILARATHLPAAHARDGEAIADGQIYVAPPDRHLLIRNGAIELSHGPRENHSRPAIDPLFRSAARAYGSRVIGVILSGALHDGAAGLLAVKTKGGTAIIQDPDDAAFPSMPQSAFDLVEADFILPAERIGAELTRLVRRETREAGEATMEDDEERIARVIAGDFAEQAGNRRGSQSTLYSCPDCGGVLWQTGVETGGQFRCHVGHAYAPETLLEQKTEEVEAALWACVRLLKEKATMTSQMAVRSLDSDHGSLAERLRERARRDEHRAQVVKEMLEAQPNAPDPALLAGFDNTDQASTGTD